MNISILICTWNNADRLKITLDSFLSCSVPENVAWELVIVNNNCTDHTDEIIKSYQDRLPILYVREPIQGLSRAKNTGLAKATGELIIFTDDDVKLCRDWIKIYWTAYQNNPRGFFWGGPVVSEFEDASIPPGLIAVHIDYAINGFELSKEGEPDLPTVRFISANWGCPSYMIKETNGFNTSLGLNAVAGVMTLGEESDLMVRLMDRGAKRWYLANAKILHFVPREKTSLSYIAKRAQTQGKAAFHRLVWNKNRPMVLGVPLLVYRIVVFSWIKWCWSVLMGRPDYQEFVTHWHYFGMWQGFYQNSKLEGRLVKSPA